jgi:hypothetical protein
LLNFDFKELLYVVATGETYEETLNKEETKWLSKLSPLEKSLTYC